MSTASISRWITMVLFAAVVQPASAQTPKPFFEARGEGRCVALNAWTDAIQARAPGVDLYAGVAVEVAVAYAEPAFADGSFVPAFGKAFGRLGDGDKKAVRGALEDCYGRGSWQFAVLATAFESDPRRMDFTWRQALARIAAEAERAPPVADRAAVAVPAPSVAVPATAGIAAGTPYFMFAGRPMPYASVRLEPCPNLRTSDVFFAPEVYAAIAGIAETDARGVVEGELVDCSFKGRKISAADVAGAAAETFLRRLDGAGIPRTEAVEALRTGRFNPDWRDVALAWRGMVGMSAYVLPAPTIAAMQRDGRWNGGKVDAQQFESVVLAQRPVVWQQLFGSYESLPADDFMHVLFSALAADAAPPVAATSRYASVRSNGSYGQRMAAIVRASAERRAVEEERARRLANLSEGERLMAALDALFSPLDDEYDLLDQFEEALLDEGGVLFANSGRDHKGVASLTLCNQTGATLRFASFIGYRARRDRLDPLAQTEYRVRGWSMLAPEQCGALLAGVDNGALLAIQKQNGREFVPYDLPSQEIDSVDLDVVKSRVVGADQQLCGKRGGNFFLSSTAPTELTICGEDYELLPFSHLVQFGARTEYRLTIR